MKRFLRKMLLHTILFGGGAITIYSVFVGDIKLPAGLWDRLQNRGEIKVTHTNAALAVEQLMVEVPPAPVPKDTRSVCQKALDTVMKNKGYAKCSMTYNILAGIIQTETNGMHRQHSENAVLINKGLLAGRNRWFSNKDDAIAAIEGMKILQTAFDIGIKKDARGKRLPEKYQDASQQLWTNSIDLGCAQTNWSYWAEKYNNNFADAFNPVKNIEVAYSIMRKHTANLKAQGLPYYPRNIAAAYHRPSRDSAVWNKYITSFERHYDKIQEQCFLDELNN